MTFSQKLSRLLRVHRAEAVSRASGISVPQLSCLRRGINAPLMKTANSLAKTFGIDVGWLIDDAKSWPPVRVGSPLLDALEPASTDASGKDAA